MSLPILHSDHPEMTMMQTRWSQILSPLLNLPLVKGSVLQSVALSSSASPNVINHKLGRNLQGWFLVRNRANAVVWDSQDSNSTPNLTLNLLCSADVTVDIYVF